MSRRRNGLRHGTWAGIIGLTGIIIGVVICWALSGCGQCSNDISVEDIKVTVKKSETCPVRMPYQVFAVEGGDPKNWILLSEDVLEADYDCCLVDEDCLGSKWGEYCVFSQQPHNLGWPGYSGLCQRCRNVPLRNEGCFKEQECLWGVKILVDVSKFISKYGAITGAPGRSVYYCK